MHVLVVPSWYPTTEAPRNGVYFVDQIRCLQNHGLKMGVVYPEHQSLRRCSWSALRRKHFQTAWTTEHGTPTLRRYGWNIWWRFPPGLRFRIRKAVDMGHRYVERHGAPDLLHAHSARWAAAAAARLSDQLGIPYVLTEHYSGFHRKSIPSWRLPLVREGFDDADVVTAVSTALRTTLVEEGFVTANEGSILPNVVDGSFFSRPSQGRASPPPFRFVTVARLRPQKNVGGLLSAFSTAFSDSDNVTLTIIGDGPKRTELERQTRRLGLSDQVSFRGTLDRAALRSALWDAHAFTLPSHHETFGVVLIEAMASGLPLVSARCGGPEDIVTPETGLLVPPDAPNALAHALRRLRANWDAFDPQTLRTSALRRYGTEAFAERTTDLYKQALR